jgi:hypothetical protein
MKTTSNNKTTFWSAVRLNLELVDQLIRKDRIKKTKLGKILYKKENKNGK